MRRGLENWLAPPGQSAAVAIVGVLVHLVARPVPGLGIAVPALLPALFAVLTAVVFHPAALAGLAYVAGTLGTLAGADFANLGKVRRLGPSVASIAGAGTFDGIFLPASSPSCSPVSPSPNARCHGG